VRPDDTPSPLSIQLFGPFEVRLNGRPLPRLKFRKSQAVLAVLVLRHSPLPPGEGPGGGVERDWLAGLLWPEATQPAALHTLRNCLTDLRAALGPEAGRLRSPTPRTLALDLAGASVDVAAFDAALARADPDSLAAAVRLYRGPLLEGRAEEWLFQERQVREQGYLTALEQLAALALARGEAAEAERYLRRAVGADPLRESAQRSLMELLAAEGNYAAALLAYRELRLRLHREINTEPDPETQALFRRLRAEAREKAGVRGQGPGVSSGRDQTNRPRVAEFADPRPLTPDPCGTLTFLFTDIAGSTRLWEEHPEAMQGALARHDRLLREAIERYGGEVFKSFGDQCCAVFGMAPAALAAALAAQQALHGVGALLVGALPGAEGHPQGVPLRVRMALHSGIAQERDGDYFGPALNRIARLLEAGHGGQVLLSRATQELVRDSLPEGADLLDLGEHHLRDLVRPEQIYQLSHPDLPGQFPPLHGFRGQLHNLPAPSTALLGRDELVAALRERLQRDEVRLLTLTGPGGTGKTRLGLEVAAELLGQFTDGVYLVDLAPLRNPHLVGAAIAQVLGVRETGGQPLIESLKGHLRDRQLLLVLDNFEHLLPAAPLVAELRAVAPGLKVLVTSRAPLRLQGEKEYPVPPLPVPAEGVRGWGLGAGAERVRLTGPNPQPPTPNPLADCPSVQLFFQRAHDVRPDFALTPTNAPAVAEICCRLDGLPLAIELAAARSGVLTPQQMLPRLEQRFELLVSRSRGTDPRHRSLWAALDWSYQLLAPELQRLFARLSIFRGGWTLEAAEAVCNSGFGPATPKTDVPPPLSAIQNPKSKIQNATALQYLEQLQESSLVQTAETAGEMRFHLLETLREYGAEQLAPEERSALARRHARFFLALAETAERELTQADQGFWLDRLEREQDNIRMVLAWSIGDGASYPADGEARSEGPSPVELGLRLASALEEFWPTRGFLQEGQAQLLRLLAQPGAAAPTAVRARGLSTAGVLTLFRGELEAARALFEESLAIWRRLEDRAGIATVLARLGRLAADQWDWTTARARVEESVALWRALDDPAGIANALSLLAEVCRQEGDPAAARALIEENLAIWRELGDRGRLMAELDTLARAAMQHGDFGAARRAIEESLAVARELGHKPGIAGALTALGHVAHWQEDYLAARAFFQETLLLWRELDHKHGVVDTLGHLALTFIGVGETAAAYQVLEEMLPLARSLAPLYVARCLASLAGCAADLGWWEEASAYCIESLRMGGSSEYEDPIHIAWDLNVLSGLALARGRPARAARLLGAAEPLWAGSTHRNHPWVRGQLARAELAVRAQMEAADFEAARAAGQSTPLDQIIAEVLEEAPAG
jgi:predicted ATPase/DNA-binding SARP family transcriptional activator